MGCHNLYESVNVELMTVKMNAQNISEQKKGIKKNMNMQEFEPKLPRDILKMSRNKSFDVRAKFRAIYSAS